MVTQRQLLVALISIQEFDNIKPEGEIPLVLVIKFLFYFELSYEFLLFFQLHRHREQLK